MNIQRNILFPLLMTMSLTACADPLIPGYNYTNAEGFQIAVDTAPAPAVPDKPIQIVIDALTIDEKGAPPSEVVITLTNLDGTDVDIPLANESGSEWTAVHTFAGSGNYPYSVRVSNGSLTEATAGSMAVACPTNSPLGASCCDASNCANGALCIVATCLEAPLDLGGFCLVGADCKTDECEENVCVPEPTCDDGKQNADETDVDCGGTVCGPCAETQGCAVAQDCSTTVCEEGVCGPPPGWRIGKGNGSPSSVTLTPILSSDLNRPADLAFNPQTPNELWVVNPTSDHITVIVDPGADNQQVATFFDFSRHFLERVVTISFSDDSTFATCGDSRNDYDGFAPSPNDFMGPALWPATRQEFYQYGPDAANVHLDMLHSSPLCMGIAAHGGGSNYFAFNGFNGVLDYYDFGVPHPDKKYGGEDHTDGKKRRYTEVKLKRVQGIPSTMHFDSATQWLYIADTGNQRIVRVNVTNASPVGMLPSFPMDGTLQEFKGVIQEDFVSQSTNILQRPSGIALHEGILYVTDYQNGNIHAFGSEGNIIRSLDTGLGNGALGGIAIGPDGLVYLVDSANNRILRIDP